MRRALRKRRVFDFVPSYLKLTESLILPKTSPTQAIGRAGAAED